MLHRCHSFLSKQTMAIGNERAVLSPISPSPFILCILMNSPHTAKSWVSPTPDIVYAPYSSFLLFYALFSPPPFPSRFGVFTRTTGASSFISLFLCLTLQLTKSMLFYWSSHRPIMGMEKTNCHLMTCVVTKCTNRWSFCGYIMGAEMSLNRPFIGSRITTTSL